MTADHDAFSNLADGLDAALLSLALEEIQHCARGAVGKSPMEMEAALSHILLHADMALAKGQKNDLPDGNEDFSADACRRLDAMISR